MVAYENADKLLDNMKLSDQLFQMSFIFNFGVGYRCLIWGVNVYGKPFWLGKL